MKRFLILFCSLALVVSLSTVAFAALPTGTPVNLLAWKTGATIIDDLAVRVEGQIRVATSEVNMSVRQWDQTDGDEYNIKNVYRTYSYFDSASNPTVKVGSYLIAEYFPMGYFTNKNMYNLDKCFSLVGIPNGTNLALDAVYDGGLNNEIEFALYNQNSPMTVQLQYYDADGNNCGGGPVLDTEYHYDTELGHQLYCLYTIQAPADAVAFRIRYRETLRVTSIGSDWSYTNGISGIKYSYIVNKEEYNTALSDYQNSEITYRLDSISTDLHAMQNRPVLPIDPPGSDKFDELEDLEDDLIQDAEGYLDSYYELMDSTGVSVQNLGNTFTAVKVFLESLLDIPALKTLVSVSLVLGLSGTILGIVGNVRIRKGD